MSAPPEGVPALHWHRLDPPEPHRAVPVLARLVAQGTLRREWAVAALLHAANRLCRPGACPRGLQARLMQHLGHAVWDWERARGRAVRDVRRAVEAGGGEPLRLADAADPDRLLRPWERQALAQRHAAPKPDPTFVAVAGMGRGRGRR